MRHNVVPGGVGLPKRVVEGVLCAALAVGVLAAPAAAKTRSCIKDGDTLVVTTRDVVVVRRGTADDAQRRYVSCRRATGHRVRLGKFAGGKQPPRLIRVQSGWVVYGTDWCSDGRYDYPVQCEPVVEWVRARDAHNRFSFLGLETITRLELCADLSVIVLGTFGTSTRQVLQLSRSSTRTLADDPDLDVRSLKRRHGRATWSFASGRHGSVACNWGRRSAARWARS